MEDRDLEWTSRMEDFFRLLIPNLTGDSAFVCLDLLETLDRGEQEGMSIDRIARMIRKPEPVVQSTATYLSKIGVIRRGTGREEYTLDRANGPLANFLRLYKTPTGRLKVIEKLLGF